MFYVHQNYCLVLTKKVSKLRLHVYSVVGTNFPSINKDDNAFGKLNYLK